MKTSASRSGSACFVRYTIASTRKTARMGTRLRLWIAPMVPTGPTWMRRVSIRGTKCRSGWGWGARLTDDCVSAPAHAGAPATTWKPPFGHLTTGRRSGALLSRAILPLGDTRREGSHPDGWGSCRRGPAGRCADRRSAFPCLRAVMPTGGWRSKPSPRFFWVGGTRFSRPSGPKKQWQRTLFAARVTGGKV